VRRRGTGVALSIANERATEQKEEKRREAMKIRTALKAGGIDLANHNETLAVRTALKAGRMGWTSNHNEPLQTRTGLKAGKLRRAVQITARKEDRLELLVVRAGLRAGKRMLRRAYR
jgi:hypothetical protein